MNCSITFSANSGSNLTVNLFIDFKQWRLKGRIPDERKYVIYNHDLNSLIKAPFGVVTAFPDNPNPVFNSPFSSTNLPSTSSSQIDLKCNTPNTSNSIMNRSISTETASTGIQTKTEIWDTLTDSQLTASLWSTEFAITELEQQKRLSSRN